MYLDTEGNDWEKSTASSVASEFLVHWPDYSKYIKIRFLPIAEILAPVIALAENGVVTEFKHKA
jgi:hypothetical protein